MSVLKTYRLHKRSAVSNTSVSRVVRDVLVFYPHLRVICDEDAEGHESLTLRVSDYYSVKVETAEDPAQVHISAGYGDQGQGLRHIDEVFAVDVALQWLADMRRAHASDGLFSTPTELNGGDAGQYIVLWHEDGVRCAQVIRAHDLGDVLRLRYSVEVYGAGPAERAAPKPPAVPDAAKLAELFVDEGLREKVEDVMQTAQLRYENACRAYDQHVTRETLRQAAKTSACAMLRYAGVDEGHKHKVEVLTPHKTA